MSAASAPSQTAMKRLAGVLSFVCLVLFLLAIEQRHTVAAWQALRDDAAPAAGRIGDWLGQLPSGAGDGLQGLRSAVAGEEVPPLAADPGPGAVLRGEYGPADEATRAAVGALTFERADLRFESGERLSTRPLSIARGRDFHAPGQTFAARLKALPDAQIELRRVVSVPSAQTAPSPGVCGATPAGVVALLHRGSRVDLMLFRSGYVIGADTPPTALCGVWSFTAR